MSRQRRLEGFLLTTIILLLYPGSRAQDVSTTEGYSRTWSAWYNTDSPVTEDTDDETVAAIRKRGIEVCGGHKPIDALCRLTDRPSVVFNAAQADVTDDYLELPCTTSGLLCRNRDQNGQHRICRDYQIRFECLDGLHEDERNVMVLSIASGLSVLIPITCVVLIHISRFVKRRRRPSSSSESDSEASTDSSESTDVYSQPPSYVELFEEGTDNNVRSSSTVTRHYTETVDRTEVNSAVSTIDQESGPRTNSVYSITNELQGEFEQINIEQGRNSAPPRQTGMRLSIFDWIQHTYRQNDITTQSPPPSYTDALNMISAVSGKKDQNIDEAIAPDTCAEKSNELKQSTLE